MAKRKNRNRRQSRFVSEAAMQALVRFGPELSGLRELQRQAERNKAGAIRSARGTTAALIGSIDRNAPRVADIYDDAGLDVARSAQTLIHKDLAGLGAAADPIKAAAGLEQQAMTGRLTEARAAGLEELADRRVQAQAGKQFAIQNARSQFVEEMSKLLGRKQDIRGEMGAFTAATVGELRESARDRRHESRQKAADRRQRDRASKRSAGIDPETGKPYPHKLPKGSKGGTSAAGLELASPEKHDERSSLIESIAKHARDVKRAGAKTRAQIVDELTKGRPQWTGYVDAKGNPLPKGQERGGTKVTVPARKAYDADIFMTAALDIALDGHLSKRTQDKLQRRYSLRQLGLDEYSYGRFRKRGGGSSSPPVRRQAGRTPTRPRPPYRG